MQVIVKGRNSQVPKRVKDLAASKLQKVERFFDRIQVMEIEFSEEHNPRLAQRKHTVEVTVTTKRRVMRAHASGPDHAAAIDAVEAKLEAQVKRLKSKLVRRGSRAKGVKKGEVLPLPALEDLPHHDQPELSPATRNGSKAPIESQREEEGDEVELGQARITRVKRFALKPMTAEEAVLQMQTLGHDFFLFANAESEQAGVVYRRRDGSFGLIEPD